MLKFWDKYGIWGTVFVLLVIQAYSSDERNWRSMAEGTFYGLFLPLNVVLNLFALYRFLARRWKWFGIWGPLFFRWIARWVGYTLIGILFGGLVFSVFGLILAPVIAVLITIFHIADDVQAVRPPARP